jgi:hypothetical protein
MSTQLYEVDVFMFFLKDLEAVTTNFYHDLWQSTRMHTPKVCSALRSLLFSTLTATLCTGAMPSYALGFSNYILATASCKCTKVQPQALLKPCK